jgi:hypothetical protein
MANDFSLEATLAELAPTPHKWRRALRVASITALGAGVMAALQIANPLGLTMLVNLSLPEAVFPLTGGIIFLFCAAVFQTLAIAGAAALANSPALELAVFILLSLVTSYLIYAVPILGRLWVWIQVPVITAFYMVLFVPAALGKDNAQMFAGMAIGVAILFLFNNLIWPEPVRSVLTDSLGEAIARSRSRFARLIAIAVGDAGAGEDGPVASQLGRHIALLGQVHRISNHGEFARIVAAVMRVERIRNQLEHVAATVRAKPPAVAASPAGAELRTLALTIDQRFERLAVEMCEQVSGTDNRYVGLMQLDTSWDPRRRLLQIVQNNPELADLAEGIAGLSDLLQDDSFTTLNESHSNLDDSSLSAHGAKPFLVRFAGRHTLALAIAFLLGLWDNNAALHAAIWLLMLGGPPSHGATVRKFTMRALGGSGALALAALGTIVVSPNYTSIVSYMAVIFIGVLLMAFVGEGGGLLSFLAIGGTAFVIGYSGPGPRTDVLKSIWSIWGISLGMIIRAALSLVWREHSYQTLAEEFQPLLRAILDLTRAADAASNAPEPIAARTEVVRSTLVMLSVANDALLEGRSAGIDADNLIEALDILLRLSFVLGRTNQVGIEPESAISEAVANAIGSRFQTWLEMLSAETESGVVRPAPLRRMVLEAAEPQPNVLREGNEPDGPRIVIPGEADRRIINLMLLLEQKLTEISLDRWT